jgi:hypothetical protein
MRGIFSMKSAHVGLSSIISLEEKFVVHCDQEISFHGEDT